MEFPDGHQFLNGRFTIIRKLGSGNFSKVYLVKDEQFNKHYALKHLEKSENVTKWLKSPSGVFYSEAIKLSIVSHPHLLKIIKYFKEDNENFILMEYVKGKDFLHYIKERETQGKGRYLPIRELLEVSIQLADVISYLHDQDPPLIFRDLKPVNILRARRGKIYLIDFSISRNFKGFKEHDTFIVGNPTYLAPEIYNQKESDIRADIFSFGATLYYFISGNIPEPLTFPSLNFQGQVEPPGLRDLIKKMIKLNRSERPENMYEVLHELKKIQRNFLDLDA